MILILEPLWSKILLKVLLKRCFMDKKITTNKAIKNAIASVKMEGFKTSSNLENQCKLILQGKLDLKDCINSIIQKG